MQLSNCRSWMRLFVCQVCLLNPSLHPPWFHSGLVPFVEAGMLDPSIEPGFAPFRKLIDLPSPDPFEGPSFPPFVAFVVETRTVPCGELIGVSFNLPVDAPSFVHSTCKLQDRVFHPELHPPWSCWLNKSLHFFWFLSMFHLTCLVLVQCVRDLPSPPGHHEQCSKEQDQQWNWHEHGKLLGWPHVLTEANSCICPFEMGFQKPRLHQ